MEERASVEKYDPKLICVFITNRMRYGFLCY